MRTVTVERALDAPVSDQWAVLADFPNISTWNSGVTTSHAIGEATDGVGAQRFCALAPMGELHETIAAWEPEQRLVVNIDSATKLPIDHANATFTLGDVTTIEYQYEPKGLVGKLLAPLLDRRLRAGFAGFLDDLESAACTPTSA